MGLGIVGFEVFLIHNLGPVFCVHQCWGVHEGVGDELVDAIGVELGPTVDGRFWDRVGGGCLGELVCWEGEVVEGECGAACEGDGVGLVGVGVEDLASGSGDFTEDGVGHPSGFGTDVLLGPFDGFIDDRVGGKAVEEQKLGGGSDEHRLHSGLDRLESASCKLGHDVAERDPSRN